MAMELHHLNTHGMMEQACNVLDGVVRLKERIAELEKLNHDLCERVTENDEIRLHWEEIEQTRAENERMKARIAELEKENESLKYSVATLETDLAMSKRWRKCSEGMPNEEGDYLVMARYPDDDEPHVEICFYDRNCEDFGHYERRYAGSGNSFGGFDGEEWVTHNVSFWKPLPSAPKEKK